MDGLGKLRVNVFGAVQLHGIRPYFKERLEALSAKALICPSVTAERVTSLIQHAVRSVPFYDEFDGASLNDLPVVNKHLIKSQSHRFLTASKKHQTIRKVSTSGSTGEPFIVAQDARKVRTQRADVFAYNQMAGWRPGQRILYLRVWTERNALSFAQRVFGRMSQIDGACFSVEKATAIKNYIQERSEPFLLLSYGSSIDALVGLLERICDGPVQSEMVACIAMAEPVSFAGRQKFEEIFGVSVHARYSNSENGLISQELPKTRGYVVNRSSFYLEILDVESDRPVSAGTEGRIVVTDLFNFSQPFIRYDTGDIGRLAFQSSGPELQVIENISGRKLDFLVSPSGDLISPHSVEYALRFIPGVGRFQFEQTDKKAYKLRIVTIGPVDLEQIKKAMEVIFSSKAEIKIELTESISVGPNGKAPLVINRCIRS